MPDFPKVATPAEVWGYSTKALTDKDGFGLADDAITAAKIAADAIGASELAQGAADKVWGTTARTITALTGQPRTDLLGENADFEAGTGTRKARIDADISSRSTLTQAQVISDATPFAGAKIAKIQDFLEEGTGTLTATGAEDTIRIYTGTGKLHCYIDLTNMVAGNSVTIRQYMTIKTAGAYRLYAQETYADVQTLPLLHIVAKPGKFGVKITLQQAAVVYKTYDWETLVEQAAA